MKRFLSLIAVALIAASSCVQKGKVNYSKQVGAIARFKHSYHKEFIEKHGCVPCHQMNVKIKWTELEQVDKGIHKLDMPSKVTCHYCHNNPKTPAKDAPTQCYICHYNMKEIEPANHKNPNWTKVHKLAYEANPKECSNCHKQVFCIDCHIRRGVIQHMVHPRNYEYTHSIEAAADPGKCSKCHHIGFCMECHTKGTWTK